MAMRGKRLKYLRNFDAWYGLSMLEMTYEFDKQFIYV